MKRIVNRGTSSVLGAIKPSNWCGDSFLEFQKSKRSQNRFSQNISLNRGTKTVLAREIPEVIKKKVKTILSYSRGTSTRILDEK